MALDLRAQDVREIEEQARLFHNARHKRDAITAINHPEAEVVCSEVARQSTDEPRIFEVVIHLPADSGEFYPC